MYSGGKATNDYKGLSQAETGKLLETDGKGLSSAEAERRLAAFGPNKISEKKRNPVMQFLKRYWGPMPWLLEFAMALTFIVGHYTEGIIIFVLLTVNAVIGFAQARKSHRAVELLKSRLQVSAKVCRDGRWGRLPSEGLVPGDLISLGLGDLVPADASVISGMASADASALTGESLPKDIAPGDVIYSSAVIRRGELTCLVVNTGAGTYFGRTVSLVQIAKPKSRQQQLMFDIVRYMMYLGLLASAVVTVYAIVIHKDLMTILSLIIVFLMGAIPVALPAVMTIVQAVGAMTLSKKGVLVTRLDSLEDASSIDTFCFDKTGTITQNRLAVAEMRPFGGYSAPQAAMLGALCSKEEAMDPIDSAILLYAVTAGGGFISCSQQSYLPFSPSAKRTEATALVDGRECRIVKGAAQTIIGMCAPLGAESVEAEAVIAGFAARGYKTLAIACRKAGEPGLRLAALAALSDPPRPDSAQMISLIKGLGIRTMMLTGDSQPIAAEIAREVGIGSRIENISCLRQENEDGRKRLVRGCDGFAEVFPEDKYRIVRLLQEDGHMVGMTGDGVNDSPALKQAELGTAVAAATDVAKASASVVLTKPGLSEIIDTIVISRQTYQRMLTWVINKVTKVSEVVFLFVIGFFWLKSMLITLLGMSLLVFANDFVTMSIATDNVVSDSSPNSWKTVNIVIASLILGLLFAGEDLMVAWLGLDVFGLSFELVCTMVLLSLVFNTQFRIMIVRERRHFWSSRPSLRLFLISLAAILLFAALGMFGWIIPGLAWYQVLTVLGLGLAFMIPADYVKFFLFRRFGL